jgi:hypothetical protein
MRWALLVCTIAVSGCAQITVLQVPDMRQRTGRAPEHGARATTTVGGSLYEEHQYVVKRGYRIGTSVNDSIGGMRITIAAGEYLFQGEADGKRAFCTERLTAHNIIGVPAKPTCFVDPARSGSFSQMMISSDTLWWRKDVPGLPYALEEVALPSPSAFKRELLYQGHAKGTLRLAYREYINDFARPAFYQDVAYEIDGLPTTVSFRSVRMEIMAADNSGLTYRVLSGF